MIVFDIALTETCTLMFCAGLRISIIFGRYVDPDLDPHLSKKLDSDPDQH